MFFHENEQYFNTGEFLRQREFRIFFSFSTQPFITGKTSTSIFKIFFEFIRPFDPKVEIDFRWRIVSSRKSDFSVDFVEFSVSPLADSRCCESENRSKKQEEEF